MKKIYTFFSEHKHLFVVSLLSGLFVIGLQTAMQKVSDLEKERRANLRLKSVSVSVVSLNKAQSLEPQPVDILNPKELDFFNTLGWVKDTSIEQTTSYVFEFEALVPVFKDKTNQFETNVKFPKDLLMLVTMCDGNPGSRMVCQKYATNKFGLTLPINVAYMPLHTTEDASLGKIVISIPQNTGQDKGIFTLTQPITLDMDPI